MNVSRLHLEADEGKREEEERRKLREEIKANDPRLSDADISRADIILAAWDREIPGNGVAQLAAHFAAVREDERRKIGVEFDATLSRLFAKLEEVRRKIDDGVKATQLFPFPFVV